MLNEAELRDFLASNIHLVEPGLTLLEKEHHLPNPVGATGRVDLLARGRLGMIVAIELVHAASHAPHMVEDANHIALRAAAMRECGGVAGLGIRALGAGAVNVEQARFTDTGWK